MSESLWEGRRERIKKQLREFLATLKTLQSEGHDVDDVLQILCDNLDDIGMDFAILYELRQMCGRHKGR
jgi:hypothetical protein